MISLASIALTFAGGLAAPAEPVSDRSHRPALAQAEDSYEELIKEYTGAYRAWRGKPRGEQGDPPATEFMPRFAALAEKGDVSSMVWLVQNVRQVQMAAEERVLVADRWASALIDEHSKDEAVGALAMTFYRDTTLSQPRREALLRSWIKNGEHESVYTYVRYSLGQVLFEAGDEERVAEALGLYGELARTHPEDRWGKRANGQVFKRTRLQKGLEIPDFESEDVDGVSFKLSDYRGQVVLLDFWGFW